MMISVVIRKDLPFSVLSSNTAASEYRNTYKIENQIHRTKVYPGHDVNFCSEIQF